MKFFFALIPALLSSSSSARNMRFVSFFLLFTSCMIVLFSTLFHYIMLYEGRDFSPITGVYWTLTVMSTLGFGDITFTSDLGKLFSIIVLLSGVLLFMLIMPFTFIRFVYQPWVDNYNKRRKPRELPPDTHDHAIVVGDSSIALSVAQRLQQYKFPYALLVPDSNRALELYDEHYSVVTGEIDDVVTYQKLRVGKAALVAAFCDDLKNTNIASTVREAAPHTLLAASADSVDALNILQLAGCDHVYHFAQMLGRSLAWRVHGSSAKSNIIARFGALCIAEAPAAHTELVGKKILECGLRQRFGLNVAGIWEGKQFSPARPNTLIEEGSILLLAGMSAQIEAYDNMMVRDATPASMTPVLILGGGRVGLAAAEALKKRGLSFFLVEKNPRLVPHGNPSYIIGNASDIEVLRQAGVMETRSVIVTTHNDDLNIYLTIYCRKLRPDVQILSRATLDRNVGSLYNAGANLVMSHASMAAISIINLLSPGKVAILSEGLNIFRANAPRALVGLNLRDSHIRETTECNVVAVRRGTDLSVPPDPHIPLDEGSELILIGTVEAERQFMAAFPDA